MRVMWPWLAVAALAAVTRGDPLPSTTVPPPAPQPADKEVQALESAAAAEPSTGESLPPESRANVPSTSVVQPKVPVREPKLLTVGREPKLMERDRDSRHRTLDRGASELAWKKWLQSPESRDPGAPPRRITPKSVFIAPSNCPEGRKIGEGCVSVHQLGKEVHDQYILEELNMGYQDGGGVKYDYDEETASTADGPLQLNLPLGPAFAAAASQNIITSVPANEKKDGSRRPDADLEAELEKLKLEPDRLAADAAPASGALAGQAPDKPERDDPPDDHGQKEVIFGNISEDTIQYTTANQTQVEPTTERQNATSTDRTQSDESTQTTATEQTTDKPPKPEIDYSDVGEAVKLISRYADVTTDDTFKGERRRPPEDGPLGTRTRQQHRRRPAGAHADLYAPPPPSIYADRLPAHLAYPHYPPPDYPFRHVQEYWSRPEQFLGPYAHNPRRHHHAYPRPRRPAAPADARDLYRLVALRRWFSEDAAADR